MIKVSKQKSTGKMIESQSSDVFTNEQLLKEQLSVLKKNAVNAGFEENDVEVLTLNQEEFDLYLETQKYQKNYADLRKLAYPSIADQLDMLWHMIDQNLAFDKTSLFYTTLASVKSEYPKTIKG